MNVLALRILGIHLVLASAGAVPAGEEARQVLLWIRAGNLAPAELDPDPAVTPRLLRMVLEGTTAPDVRPGPASAGAAIDPQALVAGILDAASRAAIEEARGIPVVDIEVRSEGPASGDDPAGADRWSHPAAVMLEKRFGRAPPPGPEEEAAVRKIRAAFGRKEAAPAPAEKDAPGRPGGKGEAAAPEPRTLDAALRAVRAIENGAPVAVVVEPVAGPEGARERDEALAQTAASLGRRGTVLALLAVARDGAGMGGGTGRSEEARAALFIAGRGVRAGRIIGRPLPLAAVGATVIRIIGAPPPPGRPVEAIDAIEH